MFLQLALSVVMGVSINHGAFANPLMERNSTASFITSNTDFLDSAFQFQGKLEDSEDLERAAHRYLKAFSQDRGIELSLSKLKTAKSGISHYQILKQGLPIKGSFLSFYAGKSAIPNIRFIYPRADNALALPLDQDLNNRKNLKWYSTEDGLILSRLEYSRSEADAPIIRTYRDLEGQMLEQETLAFDLEDPLEAKGNIFPDNRPLAGISTIRMHNLVSPTFLESSMIEVYGASKVAERATREKTPIEEGGPTDEGYFYDPDDSPLLFDQVQTYFNADRALSFYESLGFQETTGPIAIFTNTELKNNARYLPGLSPNDGTPGVQPRVQIGITDGDLMQNLAKDRDVIAHELAHHVIFQHIMSTRGESGVLHEGYADYLAYALSGDPYLGESILPGSPWLRQAKTEGRFNFDSHQFSKHSQGSLWAGLLWRLRNEQEASSFDAIVLRSLEYLNPEATIADAILGLVWADAEFYPTGDQHGRGFHYCTIVNQSRDMGLDDIFEGWDIDHCGAESADLQPPGQASDPDRPRLACGSLGMMKHHGRPFIMILFTLPILLTLRRRKNDT